MATIQNPEKSQFWGPLTVAVSEGKTVLVAADEAGCSKTYAYDLSRLPEFKQAVNELRTARMERMSGQLIEAAEQAIVTLRELLSDEPRDRAFIENARIRVASAKSILGVVLPITENVELRQRLDAIENATRERDDNE